MSHSAKAVLLPALTGLVCLGLVGGLALVAPRAALFGYLAGFVFWTSLPIGALFLLMIMQLVPGAWQAWLAGPASVAALLMPLALIAALPVALSNGLLHDLSSLGDAAGFESAYLSPWFFGVRGLVLLAGASLLAWLVAVGSGLALASIGLIVLTLAQGLLATDWIASLDPGFHSSAFGLYVLSLQILIALSVLVLLALRERKENPRLLSALLLTGILMWGYLAFMSYFIIWSGNLPAGAAWYLRRGNGIWSVAEMLIGAFHAIPAFALLFPPVRRSRRALIACAIGVLAGKYLEIGWLILPELHKELGLAATAYGLSFAGLFLLGLLARPFVAGLNPQHGAEEAS